MFDVMIWRKKIGQKPDFARVSREHLGIMATFQFGASWQLMATSQVVLGRGPRR
jgi:hypothetical protein